MAGVRSDRYESKSDADGIEELSKKLTVDLRKHIRALGPYPVLSEKWATMANSLARIANISAMERKLPKDKAEATLWECEELALRYLLEDGKLNLCLRLLEDFRNVQREVSAGSRTLKPAEQEVCLKFEKGIGELLKNAWMHSEALQTTDLPLLVSHTGDILSDAASSEFKESVEGTQPAVAIHYVLAMGKHLDSVGESRIMPLILQHHVVKNLIVHVSKNRKFLPDGDLVAAAEAMALLADSEEFRTHPDHYVEDDDGRRAVVTWRELFLSDLVEDRDVRRQLRPLLDVIDQAERKLLK